MRSTTPREVGQLPYILQARRNLRLELTERQVEILIGTILGDGYIYHQGKIQIEHSAKNKEYLIWKYDELKNLSYKKVGYIERYDKRTGKNYSSLRFWLRQYFRPWREVFYQNNEKVFPENLLLTPLSLAVWYMDDGCYSNGRCTISTDNFNSTSLSRIKAELEKRFGIEAYIRSNKKLGIRANSQTKFFELINNYIHTSMKYKLP